MVASSHTNGLPSAREASFESSHEAALRSAIEIGNVRLKKAIDDAAAAGWPQRIGAAIEGLLGAVEADPGLAELCLVHGHAVEGGPLPFDPALVQTLAGVMRAERGRDPEPGPGLCTEELVAYGILGVIAERLRRGEAGSLRGLAGELSQLAGLPLMTR